MNNRIAKKPCLWFLLCLAVFASCLPHHSLSITEGSFTANTSSSLQGTATRSSDLYPDLIHEYLTKGQNSLFLSRLFSSHRIPLRLPMPHIRISIILCIIAGLQLLLRHRIDRQHQFLCADNYMIRYIHDQDGETYRSFLF